MESHPYERPFTVAGDLTVTYRDAGHILGAAQVVFAIWLLAGFAERLAVAIATIGMWILIVLVAMANPAIIGAAQSSRRATSFRRTKAA